MRTTVDFDDDTARGIEQLRREQGLGLSEAVNELVRRGLVPRGQRTRFVQPTAALGVSIDVTNIADALNLIEGPEDR